MSEHGENIWQRRSASEIMKEARKKFRKAVRGTPGAAHTALASVHYSLVKRYGGWKLLLAVWHFRRAVVHAKKVLKYSVGDFDQVDVIATILAKAPWWLGGDRKRSKALLESALGYIPRAEPMDEMQPHTRALMLITLAGIEQNEGKHGEAVARFKEALALEYQILAELDELMARRQWVRVLSTAGFFFYDHGNEIERINAFWELQDALRLACAVSQDQAEKILAECRKRGIEIREDD